MFPENLRHLRSGKREGPRAAAKGSRKIWKKADETSPPVITAYVRGGCRVDGTSTARRGTRLSDATGAHGRGLSGRNGDRHHRARDRHAAQQNRPLFDNHVGTIEQRERKGDPSALTGVASCTGRSLGLPA